jgi:hypothetical protein
VVIEVGFCKEDHDSIPRNCDSRGLKLLNIRIGPRIRDQVGRIQVLKKKKKKKRNTSDVLIVSITLHLFLHMVFNFGLLYTCSHVLLILSVIYNHLLMNRVFLY